MSAKPDLLPPLPEEAQTPARRGMAMGFIAGLILVAGAAGLAWQRAHPARQAAARPVRTAIVTRGTLPITARIGGSTSARNFANITAPKLTVPESDRPMTLMMLAESGTRVRQGQIIAQFDPQSTADHLDDTRDGLHLRKNTLEKVRANLDLQVEVLVQNLRTAKSKLDKARLDQRTSAVRSQIQVAKFQIAVDEAQAEYDALQTDLPLQIASQTALLRIYELTTEIEQIHVDRHQRDMDKLTLHAPTQGMVVVRQMYRHGGENVTYAVGDRLSPGALLMQVVDQRTMQVESLVNQAEYGQFRIGQHAKIRLDAYPEAEYQGRVYSIGSLATSPGRQSAWLRTIPVRLQIDNPDARALPDLSASAEVLVDQVENALIVPAEALTEENGRTFVQVQKGDTVERRAVTGARIHGARAALLEGVSEGDVVVLDQAPR